MMTNKEKLKAESLKIIARLEQSLKEKNISQWLDQLESDDDLVLQTQKQWFQVYLLENPPESIHFEIMSETLSEQKVDYECKIEFTYSLFYPVTEYYRYSIRFAENEKCKIAWTERLKQPYIVNGMILKKDIVFVEEVQKTNPDWWNNEDYLRYAREERNHETAEILARAIPRTVRFRKGHPFIECAGLLVNMMSEHVAKWALAICDKDNLVTLSTLHNTMSSRLQVRLIREDRDNTWSSKYVVPWYGIDELIWLRKTDEYVSGNCPVILNIYYAILKLCGGEEMDIWQLRTDNHEVTMANLEGGSYLLTADELRVLDRKLLYYLRNVTKIYNDKLIWSVQGMTNMTEHLRSRLCKTLEENQTNFIFRGTVKRQIGQDIENIPERQPTAKDYKTSKQLAQAVKNYVFEGSCRYPNSSFLWAKYAYQTLYVDKPETYLIWSIQSQTVDKFVDETENVSELNKIINHYGISSIFGEGDRLMTADQVIRGKTGDQKAKALLYYIWKKKKEGAKGYVVITDQGSYYAEIKLSTTLFISMQDFKPYTGDMGRILLVMNEKQSYYPLVNDRNKELLILLGLREG